jgi:hypothetical protein
MPSEKPKLTLKNKPVTMLAKAIVANQVGTAHLPSCYVQRVEE